MAAEDPMTPQEPPGKASGSIWPDSLTPMAQPETSL